MLPAPPAASDRSRITAAKFDITIINGMLDSFATDCGRYPTATEGLSALIRCPTNIPPTQWRGPYLNPARIPSDPWGNQCVYRFPGLHNTNGFDLYSCGQDGTSRSGGDDPDDINNWNPKSPQGTFSEHIPAYAGVALIIIWVVAFVLSLVLCVAGMLSQRVRESLARHPTALRILTWLLLVGLLLLLISSVIPRIV